MTRWALIQGSAVANAVEQAAPPVDGGQWVPCGPDVGPGHLFDGIAFTPAAPRRWITKRSFWNRMPAANETAMRSVIMAGAPAILAAQLLRLQARVDASPYVDLDLDEARDGVQLLASAGVPADVTLDGVTLPLRLTGAEAAAVLDAPILPDERFDA